LVVDAIRGTYNTPYTRKIEEEDMRRIEGTTLHLGLWSRPMLMRVQAAMPGGRGIIIFPKPNFLTQTYRLRHEADSL